MLDKSLLSSLLSKELSQKRIAQIVGCSETTVRYWVKKHNLSTAFGPHGRIKDPRRVPSARQCRLCSNNYTRKGSLCPTCFTNVRRLRTKIAAIQLLGGKCIKCGWYGDPAGFAFHHKSGVKSFALGKMLNYPWDVIKEELSKCELHCVRCHSIEHATERSAEFMEVVCNYLGKNKEIEAAVKEWFS